MNLLSGLEKFGLKGDGKLDILNDGTDTRKRKETITKQEPVELTEKDFLLDRKVKCPICDKEFVVKTVKSSKMKRLEPDADLRPNHEYVKIWCMCMPKLRLCGYAS